VPTIQPNVVQPTPLPTPAAVLVGTAPPMLVGAQVRRRAWPEWRAGLGAELRTGHELD
jgi:hypothetical protein